MAAPTCSVPVCTTPCLPSLGMSVAPHTLLAAAAAAPYCHTLPSGAHGYSFYGPRVHRDFAHPLDVSLCPEGRQFLLRLQPLVPRRGLTEKPLQRSPQGMPLPTRHICAKSTVLPDRGGAPPHTIQARHPAAQPSCYLPMFPKAPPPLTIFHRFSSPNALRTHNPRQGLGVPMHQSTPRRSPPGRCQPTFPREP